MSRKFRETSVPAFVTIPAATFRYPLTVDGLKEAVGRQRTFRQRKIVRMQAKNSGGISTNPRT